MPVAKLTKRVVDAIETNNRRVIYYDIELKGFGVKVTPTGAKCWCVEYRPQGGGEPLPNAGWSSAPQQL